MKPSTNPVDRIMEPMSEAFGGQAVDAVMLLHGPRSLRALGLWIQVRGYFLGLNNGEAALFESFAPYRMLGSELWRGKASDLRLRPGLTFLRVEVPGRTGSLYVGGGVPGYHPKDVLRKHVTAA